MKNLISKVAAVALFTGLALAGNTAQAQDRIGGAVQQGNGAYMQKTDRESTIGNGLLNLPNLPSSALVPMTQVKFLVTPSGNTMSVWKGVAPAANRPAKRQVFNSNYTETLNGRTFNTVSEAVTMPNGDITLTLTEKGNGKQPGNGNANGNGKGNGKR